MLGAYYLSLLLSIYRRYSENYTHQLEVKAQEAKDANHAQSEFLANISFEHQAALEVDSDLILQIIEQIPAKISNFSREDETTDTTA